MQLVTTIAGHDYATEVTPLGGSRYRLKVDGDEITLEARPTGDGLWVMTVGHAVYACDVAQGPAGALTLWVRGQQFGAEVQSLREHARRKAQSAREASGGEQEVCSPMPGRVVAVLVQAGAQVRRGDTLMVIEAMKMENEVRAPQDGTVEALTAQQGALVDMGTRLCVVR